jgi:hypothetical protein
VIKQAFRQFQYPTVPLHVAPEVSREAADRMARALWHDEDQANDDHAAGEDWRMTTVAARVAAQPIQGVPKSPSGVALTWEFTGAPPGTRTLRRCCHGVPPGAARSGNARSGRMRNASCYHSMTASADWYVTNHVTTTVIMAA